MKEVGHFFKTLFGRSFILQEEDARTGWWKGSKNERPTNNYPSGRGTGSMGLSTRLGFGPSRRGL